jgi:hypothetical protein
LTPSYTKFLLINSIGDATYLLDYATSPNLFKFDPSAASISGNLINSMTGIPYGMVFGSTENQILFLVGDFLFY